MGRKSKLRRFAEVATFPNVFEHVEHENFLVDNGKTGPVNLKGRWSEFFFKNENSIILELACGKGEYTLALAQDDPYHNYIGVDVKGARIWKGAKRALDTSIPNAAFLRTRIEFIAHFFGPGEVDSIWITFPDPFERKPTRRLTSAPFLDRYREIMKPGGTINLKTDSSMLFAFTLDEIKQDPRCKILYADPDIYKNPITIPELNHKTFYEAKHLEEARTIKYLKFIIG